MLELRFPLDEDVAPAFGKEGGGAKAYLIRSLGTSDVRLANARADVLRTKFRSDIAAVRAAQAAPDLDGYLASLFDNELRHWESESAIQTRDALKMGLPNRAEAARERSSLARNAWAGALLSEDPTERRAVASWAAEKYYSSIGLRPDDSTAFIAVVDRCASTLVEAQIAINDSAAGRLPASQPTSKNGRSLAPVRPDIDGNSGLPLREYFKQVYMPVQLQTKTAKGERMLSGKDRAVRLFGELIGDLPIGSITKRHIWTFHDDLLKLPDINAIPGKWRSLSRYVGLDQLVSVDAARKAIRFMFTRTAWHLNAQRGHVVLNPDWRFEQVRAQRSTLDEQTRARSLIARCVEVLVDEHVRQQQAGVEVAPMTRLRLKSEIERIFAERGVWGLIELALPRDRSRHYIQLPHGLGEELQELTSRQEERLGLG